MHLACFTTSPYLTCLGNSKKQDSHSRKLEVTKIPNSPDRHVHWSWGTHTTGPIGGWAYACRSVSMTAGSSTTYWSVEAGDHAGVSLIAATLHRSRHRWTERRRLQRVVDQNGGHIEHMFVSLTVCTVKMLLQTLGWIFSDSTYRTTLFSATFYYFIKIKLLSHHLLPYVDYMCRKHWILYIHLIVTSKKWKGPRLIWPALYVPVYRY